MYIDEKDDFIGILSGFLVFKGLWHGYVQLCSTNSCLIVILKINTPDSILCIFSKAVDSHPVAVGRACGYSGLESGDPISATRSAGNLPRPPPRGQAGAVARSASSVSPKK